MGSKKLDPTTCRPRSGVTITELMVVLGIVATLALLGMPKVRVSLVNERVRSAMTAVAMRAAVARETAIARGCVSTMHIRSGTAGRTWVTSCKTAGEGVDTVGTVDQVATRLGVEVFTGTDSLKFNPSGLRVDYQTTIVSLAIVDAGVSRVVTINPLGKVTTQ